MAEYRPARSESLQPHTERSSRPGPELSSVEADVYVWRYELLVVHRACQKRRSGLLLDVNQKSARSFASQCSESFRIQWSR